MTVREAFSLAFGEVPEGATCHIAVSHEYEGSTIAATTVVDGVARYRYPQKIWNNYVGTGGEPYGPDISDRHAEAFLGFFGEAYDRAVKRESVCPASEGHNINRSPRRKAGLSEGKTCLSYPS